MQIDWKSNDSEILLNPRMPEQEAERIRNMLTEYRHLHSHIWISTSGTTSNAKWAALSKNAILASAAAVNHHLRSTDDDHWLHPLPDFHVGGLGIWARSYLSGATVIDYKEFAEKWDPLAFHEIAEFSQATLTALVPAQVHDLVASNLSAPESLRAVIVGGGVLEETLYRQAIALGWKLLPSYGLTECASQVATASIGSWECHSFPKLSVLPHVKVSINNQGLICITGPSLLTGYVTNNNQFVDPKNDGWLQTEDLGQLENNQLRILGRAGSMIKIGGENVDLASLESMIETLRIDLKVQADIALIAVPDQRLGHVIHLASTEPVEKISHLIDQFHAPLLPFAHIRQVHVLSEIPRTALHKLRKEELLKIIMQKF